jgi:hypothetical protein
MSTGIFQRSSGGRTTSWPGVSTATPAPVVGVATIRSGTNVVRPNSWRFFFRTRSGTRRSCPGANSMLGASKSKMNCFVVDARERVRHEGVAVVLRHHREVALAPHRRQVRPKLRTA